MKEITYRFGVFGLLALIAGHTAHNTLVGALYEFGAVICFAAAIKEEFFKKDSGIPESKGENDVSV